MSFNCLAADRHLVQGVQAVEVELGGRGPLGDYLGGNAADDHVFLGNAAGYDGARGHDNARIASDLGLSEKTVRNNVSHIFDKLGVASRAQAIVLARESGLGSGR